MTRGYHHGSTSYGLGTFYKLGRESGIWDTEIKTDMEWVTKKPATTEAHQLDWFDAVALVNNTGDWKLDDEQKAALLGFVKEEGKGLVGCMPRWTPTTTGRIMRTWSAAGSRPIPGAPSTRR